MLTGTPEGLTTGIHYVENVKWLGRHFYDIGVLYYCSVLVRCPQRVQLKLKMYFPFMYPKHKAYYVKNYGLIDRGNGGGANEATKRITVHCGKD